MLAAHTPALLAVWAVAVVVAAVVVVPPTHTFLALLERVVVLVEEGVAGATALVEAQALQVGMAAHLVAAHQHRPTAALGGPAASAPAAEQVGRVVTVATEPAGLVEPVETARQLGQVLAVLGAP